MRRSSRIGFGAMCLAKRGVSRLRSHESYPVKPRALGTDMGMKRHTAASTAALALGLFLTPVAIGATADTVAALVSAEISRLGFVSPAMAQPGPLTKAQSDALAAYNAALSSFKSILAQRR